MTTLTPVIFTLCDVQSMLERELTHGSWNLSACNCNPQYAAQYLLYYLVYCALIDESLPMEIYDSLGDEFINQFHLSDLSIIAQNTVLRSLGCLFPGFKSYQGERNSSELEIGLQGDRVVFTLFQAIPHPQ